MSRSFKKAIITISKKLRQNAYRALRKRIKQKLNKINPEDVDGPDFCDIEADTRDLGLEEYGTKMGLEFVDLDDCEYCDEEDLKKERRK